jgi:hypothetical protein
MNTIYIEKDAVENITLFNEEFDHWNQVFLSGIDLCINISDEELEEKLMNPEDPLFLAFNSSATMKLPVALNNFFESIYEDSAIISEKPTGIFFLDFEKNQCEELSKKYGVSVFPVDKIPKTAFDGHYYLEVNKNDTFKEGWKEVVKFEKPLSNSLIITDNYFFSNEDSGFNRGISNLIPFLDAYLPDFLELTYQVAIIAGVNNKSKEWWIKEYGRLCTKLSALRDYQIELEIILTKSVHARKLISNYSRGKTDQGYAIFHAENGTLIKSDNDFEHSEIFSNLQNIGTKYFKSNEVTVEKLRKICLQVSEYVRSQGNTSECMIFGCNKDRTIKNRLLN